MTPPDWLKSRDGSLKAGISAHTLFVMLGGKPLYRLDVRPAGGKFSCNITQMVNGQRYDSDSTFESEAAALSGGLDQLRQILGW